jgi:hypothetical protein
MLVVYVMFFNLAVRLFMEAIGCKQELQCGLS